MDTIRWNTSSPKRVKTNAVKERTTDFDKISINTQGLTLLGVHLVVGEAVVSDFIENKVKAG